MGTIEAQEKTEEFIKRAGIYLKAPHDNQSDDDTESIWTLVKELIRSDEFGWGRRLLDMLVEFNRYPIDSRDKLVKKRALATYKDPDLNRNDALSRALTILSDEFDLSTTNDRETLGLAGAIYKRRWDVDGNQIHLERSLGYYRRGFEIGIESDGYTAINAAFLQDLLAYLEEKQAIETGGSSMTATVRREDARHIRRSVIDFLTPGLEERSGVDLASGDYSAVATLAEASLGLKECEKAKRWLAIAREIPGIAEWEYESTARQLVHLVQIQPPPHISRDRIEDSEAWQTLIDFLGRNADALRTMFQGKLGVALSGGGFRASLYHIGVLAKMAEVDLLRHVEIISCVSGGSIIGAHYYLELRRMFQKEKKRERGEDKIKREDYIRLVEKLVGDFKAGVQENARVRILANPLTNLKMIFQSSFSRTQRLGELYEELIYSRVQDGEGDQERWLNDLFIHPVDEAKSFNPRRDNWKRCCKIPQLVLNATTLNSGHNWQFTASWMGESPVSIDTDVDSNKRYRRMYYDEAPAQHKRVRLGTAVGASSCVPGLFEPVILKDLYPETTIRLVDGGVYDNQGVASLLEQDCSVIICSDAAGQLNSSGDPGGGVISPLLRTNSIMMHRVRGAQYQDLKARKKSSLLKGFAYMHLKQGLDGEQVDWLECEEPPKRRSDNDPCTPYGVRKDIQNLLAGVRTDLDSFSDLESYALMTSGYLAAGLALQNLPTISMHQGGEHDWAFLKVAPGMTCKETSGEDYKRLSDHLKASPMLFFRVWKLYRPLKVALLLAGFVLLAGIAYLWYSHPELTLSDEAWEGLKQTLTIGNILTMLTLMFSGIWLVNFVGRTAGVAMKTARFRETLYRIAVGLSIGLVGWVGAFVHLHLFDRIFKKLGRVK